MPTLLDSCAAISGAALAKGRSAGLLYSSHMHPSACDLVLLLEPWQVPICSSSLAALRIIVRTEAHRRVGGHSNASLERYHKAVVQFLL